MFEIIALVCRLGQDHHDCSKYTAQTYFSLGITETDNSCQLQAQLRLANADFQKKNPKFMEQFNREDTQVVFHCGSIPYTNM